MALRLSVNGFDLYFSLCRGDLGNVSRRREKIRMPVYPNPRHLTLTGPRWLPAQAESNQSVEQAFVRDALRFRRFREVLTVRHVRIRVGFEDVNPPVLFHPHVDTRVPTQVQRAVRAFG